MWLNVDGDPVAEIEKPERHAVRCHTPAFAQEVEARREIEELLSRTGDIYAARKYARAAALFRRVAELTDQLAYFQGIRKAFDKTQTSFGKLN